MSSEGNMLAIGALQNNGNGSGSGHVRVYAWDGTQNNYVQRRANVDGEAAYDYSGGKVSMSSDSNLSAIGACGNEGNCSNSGHVRVYV